MKIVENHFQFSLMQYHPLDGSVNYSLYLPRYQININKGRTSANECLKKYWTFEHKSKISRFSYTIPVKIKANISISPPAFWMEWGGELFGIYKKKFMFINKTLKNSKKNMQRNFH